MSTALNILVTGCGGDIGQSIGKILLKSQYTKNLFGIDISDKNAAQFIYPNFSVGLRFSHPEYLKNLEAFIEKNAIDIFIPMAEPELRFFSEQNLLDNIGNAKIITASDLALQVGFDKYKTAEFLKTAGFPYPKTTLAKDIKKISSFPVILKSKTGSGSKDIYKINAMAEFAFYTKNHIEDYIVQEFITDQNGEFTCGLFRSKKGEIRSIIFKRELHGGYSGYGEVVENEIITNLLHNLAIKLNLEGSINVQLRISENEPKVFEINPRFSSTVLYRYLFGFEDVIWSIEDALGLQLSDTRQNSVGRKFYKGFSEYIK
ncbi:ATP-grasp domain-containing protein [Polaribacter sp. BAL334]|uniref:ATP-grasp domain-containing protein n=1 Tax=Polaribacter sp. BAL334 TaxID=1708178 RepID=UPI0018D2470B|nr:ATP-grasp domain-containing protein [Polaribacter sp. BAL334]MBG7612794.1 ATP-grasp domain-containing protein [Polaribacter sp. BAL334]